MNTNIYDTDDETIYYDENDYYYYINKENVNLKSSLLSSINIINDDAYDNNNYKLKNFVIKITDKDKQKLLNTHKKLLNIIIKKCTDTIIMFMDINDDILFYEHILNTSIKGSDTIEQHKKLILSYIKKWHINPKITYAYYIITYMIELLL